MLVDILVIGFALNCWKETNISDADLGCRLILRGMHLRSGHRHQTQLIQRPDKWHLEKMCRDDIVQMDANNSLIEQQVYREFQILVQLNHDRDPGS